LQNRGHKRAGCAQPGSNRTDVKKKLKQLGKKRRTVQQPDDDAAAASAAAANEGGLTDDEESSSSGLEDEAQNGTAAEGAALESSTPNDLQ